MRRRPIALAATAIATLVATTAFTATANATTDTTTGTGTTASAAAGSRAAGSRAAGSRAAETGPAGTGAAGTARAGTAPDGIAPEVFAALQRDLNLTPAQARARLDADRKAAEVQRLLRQRLPETHGGTWLSAAGTLVAAVTDPAHAAWARGLGIEVRTVPRSEARLDATVAALNAAATHTATRTTAGTRAAAPARDTVRGWYVDLPTNSVVVLAAAGQTAAAERFIRAAGVDTAAVRVVTTTEQPRPFIDVIGGNAYYFGSGRCSIGFSVNGGFVTAGHCGTTGTRTTQPSGTVRGSSFPGNDYAWVQVDAGNTPRGLVNNYSGGTVAVAGSVEAAVGASVCRSGSTTGWRCGTIQQKNASVTYSQGTVTGLVRSNACAEPGDSGGSWLSGSQAQGVTSGGSGNCSTGGTMYYQPVNEILSAYGLTLVTTGSPPPTNPPTNPPPTNPPTNPPGSTTWAPNTAYATGAQVTYAGIAYQCLQGHTSQVGWEPPIVPALWRRL